MTTSKVVTFAEKLETVLSTVSTKELKLTIGDSINNHRVPSIVQVIRYLRTTRKKKLADELENIYYSFEIKEELHFNRLGLLRNDGFDINELFNVLEDLNADSIRAVGKLLVA